MRIVKPCRPSAATDGRGEARKNAGRSGQLTPAQVVGAEGVPLRAIARQQSQRLRNAEIRSMPSDQRIQIIPAGPVAPRTSDRQARSVGSNLNQRDRAICHGEEVIDPNPPPHGGGSQPPLLRRSAQARARPDRHRGQWLSDGREPRPQARFRAVFHPLSSEANAKGARGFERSGYCQQRVPAVLVGYPKVSSPVTASSVEPGSYEGVTG
jgi:hypothetical protein